MVKVWKDLGLEVRDKAGRFVQIDDPRLQPVWDYLSAHHIPVLAHSADPRDGWRPLDPRSPHYQYFSTHPLNYPYAHPEIPRWETVIAARDRWLARNPGLVVVGAHLGSMADDLDGLGQRLDSYPNFNVDVSARLGDLQRLPPDRVRRFFLTYQDRILFGMDRSTAGDAASMDSTALREEERRTEAQLAGWWDYLAGTLRLPASVLTKLYAGNAMRVLRLTARSPGIR
jgi:predicted TIM-barrel fold metal-dependent hydrolase